MNAPYSVGVHDGNRVFFQIGYYKFEVVIPEPVKSPAAASALADLLRRQIDALVAESSQVPF